MSYQIYVIEIDVFKVSYMKKLSLYIRIIDTLNLVCSKQAMKQNMLWPFSRCGLITKVIFLNFYVLTIFIFQFQFSVSVFNFSWFQLPHTAVCWATQEKTCKCAFYRSKEYSICSWYGKQSVTKFQLTLKFQQWLEFCYWSLAIQSHLTIQS